MSVREFETRMLREVENHPGVSIHFGHRGKHKEAVISYEGRSRRLFYPTTPSDSRRGIHNKLKDLRQELRNLFTIPAHT